MNVFVFYVLRLFFKTGEQTFPTKFPATQFSLTLFHYCNGSTSVRREATTKVRGTRHFI